MKRVELLVSKDFMPNGTFQNPSRNVLNCPHWTLALMLSFAVIAGEA